MKFYRDDLSAKFYKKKFNCLNKIEPKNNKKESNPSLKVIISFRGEWLKLLNQVLDCPPGFIEVFTSAAFCPQFHIKSDPLQTRAKQRNQNRGGFCQWLGVLIGCYLL